MSKFILKRVVIFENLLILDLDETLISFDISPRPYLKDFLEFCFNNFKTVSIWTASNNFHFNFVYNKILKDLLPAEKSFYFVWYRKHCKFQNETYNFYFKTCVKLHSL